MPSATLETLEQRLTAMEQEIAQLKRQVQTDKPQGTLGLFADEPDMVDEMLAITRGERDKSAPVQAHSLE